MDIKNEKGLDDISLNKYNKEKMEIIRSIKNKGLELAQLSKHNIKIELNINLKFDSIKCNIEEYNV